MNWPDSEWLRLGVLVVTASVNLLVGFAVFLRKPRDLVYQTFGLLAFFYFAWCVMLGLYEFPIWHDSTLWIKWVFVFVCLFSTCTLFFSFVFPKNISPTAHRLAVLWNCIYLGISFYWLFYTNLFIAGTDHPVGQPVGTQMGAAYPVWSILTWTVLGWAIVNFLYKQNKVHAYQRKHLLYLGIAFACWGIITNVLDVILPIFWGNTHYFAYSSLSSLFFTGTVALMILKHGFMDVGKNMGRTVGSVLFSGIAIGLYISVLHLFVMLFRSTYSIWLSLLSGFFLMLTFDPLKRVINFVTRWLFFHNTYDVDHVAQEIGEVCRAELDLSSLVGKLIELLRHNIMAEEVSVILDCGEEHRQFGMKDSNCLTIETCNLIREEVMNVRVVLFDDLKESPLRDMMRSWKAAALVPLRTGTVMHGILLIGNLSSGSGLSRDDRRLLATIASPISVAVQNSLAYETIVQFNKRLKNEVESATVKLRETNKHLEEVNNMKDDFINVATHELRNPVVGIRGFAGMLKKGMYGEVPEKMVEPVKMIYQCNEMLVELVDDLLKIARSETKTFQVKSEQVNLTEIIDERVRVVTPSAVDKGLTIEYHKDDPPVMVQADSQRVGEVVHNLLSNAVKYSETGVIRVTTATEGNKVTVRVIDQGYGVSPEDQEKLFTRFFRAQEGIVHGVPGTGLGLFIVRQYIEKMGGTIGVESELGKGSTFWFALPRI